MSRKRRVTLFVSLLLLCGSLAWYLFQFHRPEPTYQGTSLSVWLKRYDTGVPAREVVNEAVLAMGTNAVPLLLEWFSAVDSPRTLKLVALAYRQKLITFHYTYAEDRQRIARYGIAALHPNAKEVVPMLIGIYEKTNWYHFEGDPTFVLEALCFLKPNSAEAVPLLIREATHTNASVRKTAVWALAGIPGPTKSVVPVLINALHDSDLGVRSLAVSSLAEYGRDATDAIPALFQLVAEETTVSQRWLYPPDEHWRVKLDAERAITRIKEASDPEAAASRLTQVLHNSSWNGRMDAARSLGRLGPAAKSAIPTLREILEEEDRALQRVPNSIDHQNMYKAVSEALAEIEKETLPQR